MLAILIVIPMALLSALVVVRLLDLARPKEKIVKITECVIHESKSESYYGAAAAE